MVILEAKLLLMDEPLSSLDLELNVRLRQQILPNGSIEYERPLEQAPVSATHTSNRTGEGALSEELRRGIPRQARGPVRR